MTIDLTTETMLTSRTPQNGPLGMTFAQQVLDSFDRRGVAYCHWKSNDHLEAAVKGLTDLDLLIDSAELDQAYAALSEFGCRRGRVANSRNEPGLEDFFGIDPETNRLVHFHVHWRLASGERHLKRFRLPFETSILSRRVRDTDWDVWITDPAQEAVLVLLRTALKLRWRDRTKLAIKRQPKASVHRELDFLLTRCSSAEIDSAAREWLGDDAAAALMAALSEGANGHRLARLRRLAFRDLGSQTSHPPLAATLLRWRRELSWFKRGVARHYRPSPMLYGRGGGSGGLLVAVLGADGSGKSTLTRDLRLWFAPKYDTYALYLGSGDGSSSLLRKPMKFVKGLLQGPKDKRRNTQAAPTEADIASSPSPAKVVWALALARETLEIAQGDARSYPRSTGDH